jgi:hypothetical protein
MGDGLAQGLDAGGRAVLAAARADVDVGGTGEAALDVVLDLGGALAQVGPLVGLLEEAILGGALSAPDDAGGCSGSVEPSMGEMAVIYVSVKCSRAE